MGMSLDGGILSLRMMYGDDRHPTLAPATVTLHLGIGDPRDSSEAEVELDAPTYPGYAPATVDNDSINFPAPTAEGEIECPVIEICTVTTDWPTVPTHMWTRHPVLGIVLDVVALDTSTGEIPLAGATVTGDLELFYDGII